METEYTFGALKQFEEAVQERLDEVQEQLDNLGDQDEMMQEPLREALEARQQRLMAKYYAIQEALVELSEEREASGAYDD